LAQYKSQPGSIFSNLHWTPKPIDPIDPKLNGIEMSQIAEGKRQKVCDQIESAAEELLEELDMNFIIRKAVMSFYVQGQIKKLLAL
jgi:hypothetical protein